MRSFRSATRHAARLTIAATLVLSWAVASFVVSAQPASLTLVSTPWSPFTNVPGQPRFALDLVETAFGRIGITATTAIVSAADFTTSLLGGRFDGSAAAWKDTERERALIFSQPYMENRLVLVGRRGTDVSARGLAGLLGKRVAIVEGYSYGDAIDTTGPFYVRSSSEEDSLARLLKEDVDYALMDELVVQYIVSNYPKESGARLQIGTTPLLMRELYLAIRRTRPDAESIISRFNAQLRGMIADGTYHRLLRLDWIRADVDGDGIPEFVAANDRLGPTQPLRIYSLFSPPPLAPKTVEVQPGFYIGGTLYSDWASVPENYKVSNSDPPDPSRSAATLFSFTW